MKNRIFVIFLVVLALCGCGKNDVLSLDNTVWAYEDAATAEFYGDNTGKVIVDGLELPFRYVVNGDKINITCTDGELAAEYGLDTLPFFGVNDFSHTEASLIIGDWALRKTK